MSVLYFYAFVVVLKGFRKFQNSRFYLELFLFIARLGIKWGFLSRGILVWIPRRRYQLLNFLDLINIIKLKWETLIMRINVKMKDGAWNSD